MLYLSETEPPARAFTSCLMLLARAPLPNNTPNNITSTTTSDTDIRPLLPAILSHAGRLWRPPSSHAALGLRLIAIFFSLTMNFYWNMKKTVASFSSLNHSGPARIFCHMFTCQVTCPRILMLTWVTATLSGHVPSDSDIDLGHCSTFSSLSLPLVTLHRP